MALTHHLAAGVIIIRNDKILLVRDSNEWSLPKGTVEHGETFAETAVRECNEETGYRVQNVDTAFVVEFTSQQYGQYLQVYFFAEILGTSQVNDPDDDILEVKCVPVDKLRIYIKFRPWVIPAEIWLKEKKLSYHSFDLDKESFNV